MCLNNDLKQTKQFNVAFQTLGKFITSWLPLDMTIYQTIVFPKYQKNDWQLYILYKRCIQIISYQTIFIQNVLKLAKFVKSTYTCLDRNFILSRCHSYSSAQVQPAIMWYHAMNLWCHKCWHIPRPIRWSLEAFLWYPLDPVLSYSWFMLKTCPCYPHVNYF